MGERGRGEFRGRWKIRWRRMEIGHLRLWIKIMEGMKVGGVELLGNKEKEMAMGDN